MDDLVAPSKRIDGCPMETDELLRASATMWRSLAAVQTGSHRVALLAMATELDRLAAAIAICAERVSECPLRRPAQPTAG